MSTVWAEDISRAGRWIGWILANAEIHQVLDNEQAREVIRKDKKQRLDRIHKPTKD
jgi:hypothetical protein